jgi:aryl-alcohol dehydrogenase-like predicted oxidoreductase
MPDERDTPGSRLGLGLAAVARPAYITSHRGEDLGSGRAVPDLRARTHALLDAAYACGVRYVDVARSYGRAEEFLAGWLAAHPEADDVEVGSKWGYRYVGDWRMDAEVHEIKDHSPEAFAEQLALTRSLLGDRLGVYHVHSATPGSPALTDRRLQEALAALRDEGLRIGVSTSGPAQTVAIRQALDVSVDGHPLFTSIESTWNLLEPSAGPALAEAASAGARVIVKEVVANGRLTPGADDPAPAARAAVDLARQLGVGVDQLAVAAALAHPWAWRVLSGAVTVEQLTENLGGGRLRLDAHPDGEPDTAERLVELIARADPPERYWAERSARPWT